MQPVSHSLPSVQLDSRSLRVQELLTNLQNAGLFRAIVVKQNGNQLSLDTAFGKLTGTAPDQLKSGDEILARLVSTKPVPTLKVEQHTSRLLTLQNKQLNTLVQNSNSSMLAAKVLSHNGNKTLLQVNQQAIPIARQNILQVGETLLLKPTQANQMQLIRVQPQNILKTALSALLPRNLNNDQQYNLSTLQKMSSELVQAKMGALIERANTKNAQLAAQNNSGKVAPTNPSGTQSAQQPVNLKQVQLLNQLLSTIAQSSARIDNIKPQTLQQMLSLVSIFRTTPASSQMSLGQSLQNLLADLKTSPENFRQLVRQLIELQQPLAKKTVQPERPIIELSNTLRLELLQQTEQTLNQLLTQHTSTRLQLEQNLPLQINLNIPILVDQDNKNLKLSIKQKSNNDNDELEQSWEIELSFEFGLLGLISTRILLQEQKISANFWAVEKKTKIMIDDHMDEFKTQLKKAGFELGLFDSFLGQAPQPETKSHYPINDNLVDLEA